MKINIVAELKPINRIEKDYMHIFEINTAPKRGCAIKIMNFSGYYIGQAASQRKGFDAFEILTRGFVVLAYLRKGAKK